MNQNNLVVTADDVDSVDGSLATVVNDCGGKGIVALASTVIFNVHKRRNIKLADPCGSSVTAAVNMTVGGGVILIAEHLGVMRAWAMDGGGEGMVGIGRQRTIGVGWRRPNGGTCLVRPMLLPTRSLPTRSHVVVRASSSGKPVINGVSVKAVILGDVHA